LFCLTRPSEDEVRRFISDQSHSEFSYPEVGASAATPPPGYNVDHCRIKLGSGERAWQRAVSAVRRWQMFDMPWVELCWPATPIREGAVVAVSIRQFGFFSLNAARIVYLVEESSGKEGAMRFGFAYGTLPGHAESGEERFTVEWSPHDGSVSYEILAFSRPKHPMAKLAYPFSRHLQKKFGDHSRRAMFRAVNAPD
jgi:uncharacterized protein (UPF0548 family)